MALCIHTVLNIKFFKITFFLFISLPAKRNEPKKEHPGVIVIRSHSVSSREFQTKCASYLIAVVIIKRQI